MTKPVQSPGKETVLFTSICLSCFEEQPQRAYSRAVLGSCLEGDHANKAYCAECDEFWDVSPRERGELARAPACSSPVAEP